MSEQVNVPRTPPTGADSLKAFVESSLQRAYDKAKTERSLELTVNPLLTTPQWEVVSWGPWQDPFTPAAKPGRIIFLGSKAYIATAVVMDDATSVLLAGFGAKIQLSYHTANTQKMVATNLATNYCFPVVAHQTFYVHVWEFTPTEAACLYETNVCARVCNCANHAVPGWAGFVRYVYDFDPDKLWMLPWGIPAAAPGWQFDRSIRFMVADPDATCDC